MLPLRATPCGRIAPRLRSARPEAPQNRSPARHHEPDRPPIPPSHSKAPDRPLAKVTTPYSAAGPTPCKTLHPQLRCRTWSLQNPPAPTPVPDLGDKFWRTSPPAAEIAPGNLAGPRSTRTYPQRACSCRRRFRGRHGRQERPRALPAPDRGVANVGTPRSRAGSRGYKMLEARSGAGPGGYQDWLGAGRLARVSPSSLLLLGTQIVHL